MTLVQDNSVQAINAALLSVKRDISVLTATKSTCEPSSGSTGETTAGLEPGKTYNINISGNAATATRATSATSATTADKATTATTAETATNANHAETATTAETATNANHATTADKATTATTANHAETAGTAETATTATTAETATNANHAETATTAGNADRARNMYYQNLDLSALDKTKFYPLVCYSGIDFAEVAICSESGMASMDYNQNRIHFDISTMGWSDLPPTLNIREYACYENNEITIGCIGRGVHNGAWAIWLRGGLHYTCFSRNSDLSLKTSDYTFGDETYTVGTNYYGGSNTNVSIMFTPQSTIKDGAYSSRQIAAIEIKASNRMRIPIGAPSSLVDGCIWIER